MGFFSRWKSPPPSKVDAGFLKGRQLTPRELAHLCSDIGFRGENLVKAVATCLSESQGYDEAYHDNVDDNGKLLSRDVGIFQINIPARMIGSSYERDLVRPSYNARIAYRMWQDRGFQPWHGYTKGIALDPKAKGQYIHKAIEGVANYWAWKYGIRPIPWFNGRL